MKKKFELVFTKEALRRLRELNRQTHIRILKESKILEEQPFAGKRLVGRLNGFRSFRVGEYRVIYQHSKKTVIIRTVGHRKKVY